MPAAMTTSVFTGATIRDGVIVSSGPRYAAARFADRPARLRLARQRDLRRTLRPASHRHDGNRILRHRPRADGHQRRHRYDRNRFDRRLAGRLDRRRGDRNRGRDVAMLVKQAAVEQVVRGQRRRTGKDMLARRIDRRNAVLAQPTGPLAIRSQPAARAIELSV